MTQHSWPWSTVAGLGDGASELGESDSRAALALYFRVQDPSSEGVSHNVGDELEVTGVASPLSVGTGSAICYGIYWSDAVENVAVSTPAVGTTGGRIVLQTNWAGTGGASLEARTRIALKMSADGVATPPGLTQTVNTTWEISLATFTITTGGVIAVTDARVFRRPTCIIKMDDVDDAAIDESTISKSGGVLHVPNSGITPTQIANRLRRIPLAFTVEDGSTSVQRTLHGWDFPYGITQYIFGGFPLPTDWVSGGEIVLIGSMDSPSSGFDVVTRLRCNYGAVGESRNTHSEDTGNTVISPPAGPSLFEAASDILTSLSAGDFVGWYFSRVNDASDTWNADLSVLTAYFEYTADS